MVSSPSCFMNRLHTLAFAATIACSLALTACNKPAEPAKGDKATEAASLLVGPQDLIKIQLNALTSGPPITGSIQPQRRADLRSEVSSVVVQVFKDNGDVVRKGDLLVRLDETAIRDSLNSADEAARAAGQSFEQAERQFQRLKTLRESGMASTQQLEDAEIRRNNAQSDLAAAKARAAQARQQLQYTRVTAPFDGVVSDRKVSAGDTAQVGKELLKVQDPSSMRFEGLISADAVAGVKIGQPVHFRVSGFKDQEFLGAIKRISPSANASTRQVEVLVDFTDGQQPHLSGLYAEGNIETGNQQALTLPANVLVQEGDKAFAWRVKDGVLQKVAVTLGERDVRHGDYVVRVGIAAGDQLVRNPTSSLKDGQKVQLTASTGK